jgi:hypothetical protein
MALIAERLSGLFRFWTQHGKEKGRKAINPDEHTLEG